MTDHQPRSSQRLFRSEALEHYLEKRDAAVLPRFVMPRTLLFIWFVLALLLAAGYLAWSTQIPVFVSGTAVVVQAGNQTLSQGERVVALFPPGTQLGRNISLTLNGTRLSLPITTSPPEVLSPAAINERYGVPARQPARVAIAPFKPPAAGPSAAAYLGSTYRAEVQSGSQRVFALLPLVGSLFR
jgi:hypothetical protein